MVLDEDPQHSGPNLPQSPLEVLAPAQQAEEGEEAERLPGEENLSARAERRVLELGLVSVVRILLPREVTVVARAVMTLGAQTSTRALMPSPTLIPLS